MLNGFVKVRRGIVEHLHNGQMNMREFACYCVLLLRADYKTGVAWVRASDFLVDEEISLSSVQRSLAGLEEKQYIKRFILAGSKKPYPVLIDKYEIPNGDAGDVKRINAVKSTSWKYPVYEDEGEPLRSRWGGDAEPQRSRNGAVTDAPASLEESTTSVPKEVRSNNLEEISEKEEQDMNIKNSLIDKSRAILGVRIDPTDKNWSEIKALVRVYGESAVEDKFEQWAKSQTQAPNYPLSGFVRVADALLTGKFESNVSPEDLSALVNDLVVVSDGRVVFNNNHRAALGALLVGNSPADIKSAFQEFWGNIDGDEFLIKQAAKTFTEAAEQLLFVRAKHQEDARKQAALIAVCTENEQVKAAEEARKLLEADVAEQDLIEDTL